MKSIALEEICTSKLKFTYVSDAKQKDRNSLNYNFVNVSHGHRRSVNSKQSHIQSLLDVRILRCAQKSQHPTN